MAWPKFHAYLHLSSNENSTCCSMSLRIAFDILYPFRYNDRPRYSVSIPKDKRRASEKLDELMSPKSCTSNHKKIRHWNALLFLEYYGHARSRRHNLTSGAGGNLRYALSRKHQSSYLHYRGKKSDIDSACDTEVHSIMVECVSVQQPFRPVCIHFAPSCGMPINIWKVEDSSRGNDSANLTPTSRDYVMNQLTFIHFVNVIPYSTHIFKSSSIVSNKLRPDTLMRSCHQKFFQINESTAPLYSSGDKRLRFLNVRAHAASALPVARAAYRQIG